MSFTYPSQKDRLVLDKFSAVFEQGKTTALERFYDPENGRVTLDGVNLKDVNLT